MIPNIFHVFVCVMCCLVVCDAIGVRAVKLLFSPGLRLSRILAPLFGYVLISTLCYFPSMVFGFSRTLLIVVLLILLCVSLWKQKIDMPRWLMKLLFGAAVISVVAAIGLFIHPNLCISSPLFDHAKVAITNNIVRQGLPVINPFSVNPQGSSLLHYYYAWYFSGAVIASLFNISGYAAIIVNTWLTASFAALLMMLLICEFSDVQPESVAMKALALTGVCFVLPQFSYPSFFRKLHSLELLAYQLTWVPQHVFSAVLLCAVFYFFSKKIREDGAEEKNCKKIAQVGVISLGVFWAFGSSVWVGGITFFAVGAIMFVLHLTQTKNWRRVLFWWLGTGVCSMCLSLIFIINFLGAAGNSAKFPVECSLWRSLESNGRLINVAAYFSVTAFIYFGAAYIAFIKYILRKKHWQKHMDMILVGVVSLCVPLLLKSRIANNDLGWRAILPFVFVASAMLCSCLLDVKESDFRKGIFLILIGFQLAYGKGWYMSNLFGQAKYLVNQNIFAQIKQIQEHVPPNSRVLINPEEGNTSRNLLVPILLDRNLSHWTHAYVVSLGEGGAFGRKQVKWMRDTVRDIFVEGKVNDRFLEQTRTEYVVLFNDDKIFMQGLEGANLSLAHQSDLCKIYAVGIKQTD